MSRPLDWWVLDLESDPAPGSCEEAEALAGRLTRFADDAEHAGLAVRSMGEETVLCWTSLSADRFAERFDDFPAQILRVCASHRMAAEALTSYVPRLRAAQADADRALADGKVARSRLEAAVDAPLTDARGRPASAESALDAAKALAEQARRLREDAAATCAKEIGEASAAGIPPRSFWDKLADGFQMLWEATSESAKWVTVSTGAVALSVCAPASWLAPAVGGPLLGGALADLRAGRGSVAGLALGVLGGLPGVVGMTSLARLKEAWQTRPADFAGVKVERPGPAAVLITRSLSTARSLPPYATSKSVAQSPLHGRVDVSTGRVLIVETDLEVPGDLPIRLSRTHRSGLRPGRFFGDDWASTLDQRVQVEDDGLHLVLEDGTLLSYPEPGASGVAHPRHGTDRPLSRTQEGGFVVEDPESGCSWRFAAPDEEGAALLMTITRGAHRIDVLRDGLGVPVEVRRTCGTRIEVRTTAGRVTAIGATGFGYDDEERLVSAGGTAVVHDPAGRVVRHGDEVFSYDRTGRCVRSGASVFAYEIGRTLATDGPGGTTAYSLNDHRQVVATADPVGVIVTTQWDAQHRPVVRTDARGGRTTWDYGLPAGPVARTDAIGARRLHRWDAANRPLTVTNELGQTWHFGYDAAGRPARELDFEGRERVFDWDEHGRLTRDGAIGYAYDDRGRLAEERIGDRVTQYSWTDEGRIAAAVTEGGVTVEIWRDAAGRTIAEGVDGTVTTRGATWECDHAGHPVIARIAGHTLTFTYDASGAETSRELDGTFRMRTERDAAGRPLAQVFGADGERREFRRAHGDVIAIEDRRERREIDRDALGRVTGFGAERYAYDPIGLLISPLIAGGRPITRDSADGRRWLHEWDDADRMTAVTTPDGVRWTYRYDGLGRRVAKECGRERYTFGWLGHRLVEQRHTVGDGPVRVTTWVHHPVTGHVVAQVDDGRLCAVVTDEAGTPTDLADPSGERIWQRRATLWGLDPTSATPLRFPGHYRDAETGLHHHRGRYYDPVTARYLTPDRRGLRGGPNPYAYATDPFTVTEPHVRLDPPTIFAAQQIRATRAALSRACG
ncbi:RHS repeat-associated core domain-containing protein [Actinoplanes sp. NBRC 103695]|uniref:RHS repeat domain-containing protein n=1 Tax=Actinoplanes sp. NBRC 103695 TaxID=3032202 RepID=UPI0024A0BBDD|nr:RHS repeat-associated core domain-containing protein [Actinoplanes sp. NBRC 103695]GLY98111.1 hypothetical protein Acsp02_53650 [Actinoplanes sp. NBRC 103695]